MSGRGANLAGQVGRRGRDVYAPYVEIMTEFLIGLGANLPGGEGDLASTLASALNHLDNHSGISVSRASPWYRTPAWPPGAGPDFVNGAAALESALSPNEILVQLHKVEDILGRERKVRWGPRVCDLDLLAAGDLVLPDTHTLNRWMAEDSVTEVAKPPEELLLPHPRLHSRGFVLVPTCDIAPQWRHPILQRTAAELLADLPRQEISDITRLS